MQTAQPAPALLPNGNVLVPRRPGRSLDPLSPEAAFTPVATQRIRDLIEEATAPLREIVAKLLERVNVLTEEAKLKLEPLEMPAQSTARVLKTAAKLADSPDPTRTQRDKPRARVKAADKPKEGAPAAATTPAAPATLTPACQQVLDRAGSPALKKMLLPILTADAPDAVKIQKAKALIAQQNAVGSDTISE